MRVRFDEVKLGQFIQRCPNGRRTQSLQKSSENGGRTGNGIFAMELFVDDSELVTIIDTPEFWASRQNPDG